MHKSNSPMRQEKVTYCVLPNGTAHVWIRSNETPAPETEDGPSGYDYDEVFCTVNAQLVSKEEIENDADFWLETLKDMEDGTDANFLSIENMKIAKLQEIATECEKTIHAGVDVDLDGEAHHFGLTANDQINLFGKQAQLASGAEKFEYHEDGCPCVYYNAQDMKAIIETATYFVSYHTTYCNSLNMWIKGSKKSSEVSAIKYGATIPAEYESVVLADYLGV